jgi:hypothetical protein
LRDTWGEGHCVAGCAWLQHLLQRLLTLCTQPGRMIA